MSLRSTGLGGPVGWFQQTLQYKGRKRVSFPSDEDWRGYNWLDKVSLSVSRIFASNVSLTAHPAISKLGDAVGRAFSSWPSVVRCTCCPGCAACETMAHGKS